MAPPIGRDPVNRYLVENLEEKISDLNAKAFSYNVLEKISWVAFTAITVAAYTIFHCGIVLTGIASAAMVTAILSTPFLLGFIPTFSNRSNAYSKSAQEELSVLAKLKEIENWNTESVQKFLEEQDLIPDEGQTQALTLLNPQEPLKALLPLIARFQHFQKTAEDAENESRMLLNNHAANRTIRLVTRQDGWKLHEREAIPRALFAACILQAIQNPYIYDFTLEELGTITAKRFDERFWDYKLLNEDTYFTIHEDLRRNRPPIITHDEIAANLEPKALRMLLFPKTKIR